ncbi:MAG: amidophosphoribosyltransferase [Oscillospiraceae bacterium]|nr:amidophosphoribosyltransferase [Oscillospiraceae bacterium]
MNDHIESPAVILDERPKEECAVLGVSIKEGDAIPLAYAGLVAMQHRGQEAAGMAMVYEDDIKYHKDMGLVNEVFSRDVLSSLTPSKMVIGHTRYSTMGNNKKVNAGPFYKSIHTGRIAATHNGNITNAKNLRKQLRETGVAFKGSSDSEVVAATIASEIMAVDNEKLLGKAKLPHSSVVVSATVRAANKLRGAYSLIIASGRGRLIALRDPSGFRPLCIGKNENGCAIASESCALDTTGFKLVRDVLPGEVVVVENGEITFEKVILEDTGREHGLCIFEYVYFARPDSVIDGLLVQEARINIGKILARECPVEADIVCAIPDSGNEAAMGYSQGSGIPLVMGIMKNRYVGRSFIYPTQLQREEAVQLKLNTISQNVRGKRVVLVDDSLVRGTTAKIVVANMRAAGAKSVHMCVSSPTYCNTCNFGTDIGDPNNLIANTMTKAEMCEFLGLDSLHYLTLEGLQEACAKSERKFCAACFSDAAGEFSSKKVFE